MSPYTAKLSHLDRCIAGCVFTCRLLRKRFENLKSQDKKLPGIGDVDADKTIRFFAKLWKYRCGTQKHPMPEERNILPVKLDVFGKHGFRVSFPVSKEFEGDTGDQYTPVLDAMLEIDRSALTTGHRMLVVNTIEKDWGPIHFLEPQVSSSQVIELARRELISNEDILFLDEVADLCGVLSELEMIAIGRHEEPVATRHSIIWELASCLEWSRTAIGNLKAADLDNDPTAAEKLAHPIWSVWSFAREGMHKVGIPTIGGITPVPSDRTEYRNALPKILENCRSTTLNDIITKVQTDEKGIWDNLHVKDLRFNAFAWWCFANYFSGTLAAVKGFGATTLKRKLATAKRPFVKSAFENLKRLVCFPAGTHASDFSDQWWNEAKPIHQPGCKITISPQDVWDAKSSVAQFAEEAVAIVQWLDENYANPVIEELRQQES